MQHLASPLGINNLSSIASGRGTDLKVEENIPEATEEDERDSLDGRIRRKGKTPAKKTEDRAQKHVPSYDFLTIK